MCGVSAAVVVVVVVMVYVDEWRHVMVVMSDPVAGRYLARACVVSNRRLLWTTRTVVMVTAVHLRLRRFVMDVMLIYVATEMAETRGMAT